MKKLLLILLSLVLCFSAFACTTNDDTSSTTSTESKTDESSEASVDNSDASSTESEVSADISDDSSDASSNGEKYGVVAEYDLEKVLYFEGNYVIGDNYWHLGSGVIERHSDVGENSLTTIIQNKSVEDDVYFLVGLKFPSDISEDNIDELLLTSGFIEDIDNGFSNKNNPYTYFTDYESMTQKEKEEWRRKRFEILMPDVDLSNYDLASANIPVFDRVGYVNLEIIKQIGTNADFIVQMTWFPSPDNVTIWFDAELGPQ